MNQLLSLPIESRHGRRRVLLALLAASAIGLLAWSLPGKAHATDQAVVKPTVVKVTMGRPSEFVFTLSKSSAIPVGKVAFVVTNKGAIGHSFKICAKAVTSAKANSCVGTTTKVLSKGKSQTISVTLKKGKYEFLCTVSGHAKLGMKGLVGVGTTVPVIKPKPTTTTTSTTPNPTPGACATPGRATTVTVGMVDFAFAMSLTSIPCGTITFVDNNTGQEDHNFSVGGMTPGPIVAPGGSASQTLSLSPGTYSTRCDVGNHAGAGMVGSFTVTA